jgi:hypothetical protein
MTFAQLRQKALQAGVLNSALFAEDVQIQVNGTFKQIRAKVEVVGLNDSLGRLVGATGILPKGGTFDDKTRLRVTVSRDPNFTPAGYSAPGSLTRTPQEGDQLIRAAAVDPNRRVLVFRGETEQESDQMAVYIFERPTRVIQGGRA